MPVNSQGLNTFNPTVTLPNGLVCDGRYDETVGTCLLFSISQVRGRMLNVTRHRCTGGICASCLRRCSSFAMWVLHVESCQDVCSSVPNEHAAHFRNVLDMLSAN